MCAAIINGMLGTILSFLIGTYQLNLNWPDIVTSILGSNLAALVAIFTTLKAERIQWLIKVWLNRSMKTWALLASLYFLILLGVTPVLRNYRILAAMILPLILSTGFAMVIFGPIQDQLVRRQQRRRQN